MLEQLTIKNLYNHMDETIAKDIFEGVTSHGKSFQRSVTSSKNSERHFRQTNTIR